MAGNLETPRGDREERPGPPPTAEWLDADDLPQAEVERALADLDTVYRWLLGRRVVRRTVLPLLPRGGRARWLDLGSGGGHVGADLVRVARRRGTALEVVELDRKLGHLLAGRRRAGSRLQVVAAAEALPFGDGSLHGSFSHLFFHHFDAAGNRRILGEMERVSRDWAVVVDLDRSWMCRTAARVLLRLLRLGPTAYHDGLVSVARSYRALEVAEVVAGSRVVSLGRRFPCRWALVLRGGPQG
ncbi:MAG TPA: methyltransferase domain-containing protein [Thermoanaerobaculia bacterium]|nr:methyltransferase domain-containing protein [Thermoanaerobaculia bacterium]